MTVFRHAMLVNQLTEKVTVPLNAALQSEGRLELANSTSECVNDISASLIRLLRLLERDGRTWRKITPFSRPPLR